MCAGQTASNIRERIPRSAMLACTSAAAAAAGAAGCSAHPCTCHAYRKLCVGGPYDNIAGANEALVVAMLWKTVQQDDSLLSAHLEVCAKCKQSDATASHAERSWPAKGTAAGCRPC